MKVLNYKIEQEEQNTYKISLLVKSEYIYNSAMSEDVEVVLLLKRGDHEGGDKFAIVGHQ